MNKGKYLKMKVSENPIILEHLAPKIKDLIAKIEKKLGVCKSIKSAIDEIGRLIIGVKLITSSQTKNKDLKALIADLKM